MTRKKEGFLIVANVVFLGLASFFGFTLIHNTTGHPPISTVTSVNGQSMLANSSRIPAQNQVSSNDHNTAIDPKYTGVSQSQKTSPNSSIGDSTVSSATATSKSTASSVQRGQSKSSAASQHSNSSSGSENKVTLVREEPLNPHMSDSTNDSAGQPATDQEKLGTLSTNPPTTSKTDSQKPKSLAGFHELYKVPQGYVALTFDDGPSDYTKKIADLLSKNHAPAAFFFIGVNALKNPSAVTYASKLGFVIGDHSYSHPELTKLSASGQASQILQGQKELEKLTKKPVTLFRPPYGAFNQQTKLILTENHMKMALWNDDPRDWADHSPNQLVKNLASSDLSGKVIDLHDKQITYEALPDILTIIKQKGLKITVF